MMLVLRMLLVIIKLLEAVSGNTAESNLRKVSMDDDLVKTARSIGINLGD